MNISSVRVDGLFGLFSHKIILRRRERITILHGQNGVGKTTILRMLKAVCAFEFYNLSHFYFSTFEIVFDDGPRLRVVRRTGEKRAEGFLDFYLDHHDVKADRPIYTFTKLATEGMDESTLRRLIGIPIGSIEDVIEDLDQVGPRVWRVIPTGEIIGLDEVLNLYGDRLSVREDVLLKRVVPEPLKLRLRGNSVYLIETQRLIARSTEVRHPRDRWGAAVPRSDRGAEGSAVEEISRDLASRISDALQLSGRIAAKLDAQFAYKLLTGAVSEINEQQIRENYAEYRDYNNRLVQAGIFESQYIHDLPSKVLESGDKRALSLYLNDVQEKLKPFGELLNKVLLFVSIINGRFRNKTVIVDKEKGFRFRTSKGPAELAGSSLSSGEQHELVLMYTLLFRVPAASLIAIDEPELSLHVTWQQKFLDDLKSMSETADLDFLIATHSPSIINGRLDLTVELDS